MFRNDPLFWRRLVAALRTLTEQNRVWWWEAFDEPTLMTFFPDGMIHLVLPEQGGWPPEVVVFGRWHEREGVLRPASPEDLALVEGLYRAADQAKKGEDEDIWSVVRGKKVVSLEEIYRQIDEELAKQPTANGARGGGAGVRKR